MAPKSKMMTVPYFVFYSLLLLCIILLLILSRLLFNHYRYKQRTNELLQAHQETINESDKEINLLNDEKMKLLKEKVWLINEIHHRVKNNLQMVISLLNAQSEFLNNPTALNAIKESRERMQAIALIHQKLHEGDNTAEVNMRSYINELVDCIKSSLADIDRINFNVDVDDVGLDISQSVPLGLILNEAITNAVKHAYPKNENGWIQISLKQLDSAKLQLKVTDKGRGLPDSIDAEHSDTLGLQLIKLFSEQLDGDLLFLNKNGLEIILNFNVAVYRNSGAERMTPQ